MRIDELVLRNYRCFEERSFTLHPQFNCITGANASGKTAILDALTAPLREWINGVVAPDDFWNRMAESDVRLEYKAQKRSESYEPQYPAFVRAFGNEASDSFVSVSNLGDRSRAPEFTPNRDWLSHLARARQQQVQEGKPSTLPLLAYYQTTRLYQAPQSDGQQPLDILSLSDLSRSTGYADCLDASINLRALRSWMDRQARIEYEEKKESLLSKTVRNAIRDMLFEAKEVRYSSRFLDMVVTFKDGTEKDFRKLSDGQRNLVSLAGDMAMRAARLNPHLGSKALMKTEGIVLIDELDLHLHPEWQRGVVDNLKKTFPKIQFFVTTHSPFIIQALSEGEHIPLDGGTVDVPGRYGIEEIARGLMGVERPEVSEQYQEQVEAAKDYLQLIDEAAAAPADRLEEYKRRLAARLIPLAENPAYQAFLELKYAAKLGG